MRRIVDRLQGTHRLLIHGRVNPNQPGDLEAMDELKERWGVCAWKTYTQWGPDGKGFFLSDDVGIALHREGARARRQGDLRPQGPAVRQAVLRAQPVQRHRRRREALSRRELPHLPLGLRHRRRRAGVRPRREARRHRHADPLARRQRRQARTATSTPSSAARGASSCAIPTQAAHALGKLIKYCGEDNVLWGTDSIWYGSPQDQIQAFRTFQIAPELREKHGYPEITPALRAKIFGLNAAKVYNAERGGSEEIHGARRDRAASALAYRERPRAALPHLRAEDAAGVPQPARLERRRRRIAS